MISTINTFNTFFPILSWLYFYFPKYSLPRSKNPPSTNSPIHKYIINPFITRPQCDHTPPSDQTCCAPSISARTNPSCTSASKPTASIHYYARNAYRPTLKLTWGYLWRSLPIKLRIWGGIRRWVRRLGWLIVRRLAALMLWIRLGVRSRGFWIIWRRRSWDGGIGRNPELGSWKIGRKVSS